MGSACCWWPCWRPSSAGRGRARHGHAAGGRGGGVRHHQASRPGGPSAGRATAVLRSSGIRAVLATIVLLASAFGTVDVTVVAGAEQLGLRTYAGPLLALWALGMAGLVFGSRAADLRPEQHDPPARPGRGRDRPARRGQRAGPAGARLIPAGLGIALKHVARTCWSTGLLPRARSPRPSPGSRPPLDRVRDRQRPRRYPGPPGRHRPGVPDRRHRGGRGRPAGPAAPPRPGRRPGRNARGHRRVGRTG